MTDSDTGLRVWRHNLRMCACGLRFYEQPDGSVLVHSPELDLTYPHLRDAAHMDDGYTYALVTGE